MKVHAATIADLEPLLDRFLAHGHTTSSFVVSTPVPPRPVLPAPEAEAGSPAEWPTAGLCSVGDHEGLRMRSAWKDALPCSAVTP